MDEDREYRPTVIVGEDRKFTLYKPLPCKITYCKCMGHEHAEIRYEPLGIVTAWIESWNAVIKAFAEEFETVWTEYGCADDIELTEDAQKLAGTIRGLVKTVQETSIPPSELKALSARLEKLERSYCAPMNPQEWQNALARLSRKIETLEESKRAAQKNKDVWWFERLGQAEEKLEKLEKLERAVEEKLLQIDSTFEDRVQRQINKWRSEKLHRDMREGTGFSYQYPSGQWPPDPDPDPDPERVAHFEVNEITEMRKEAEAATRRTEALREIHQAAKPPLPRHEPMSLSENFAELVGLLKKYHHNRQGVGDGKGGPTTPDPIMVPWQDYGRMWQLTMCIEKELEEQGEHDADSR